MKNLIAAVLLLSAGHSFAGIVELGAPEAAAAGASAAAEAIRQVGRSRSYCTLDDFAGSTALPDRADWPWCGEVKSLTPKGEASLLYMESERARLEAEKTVRTREALLAQARALAALAGSGEEVSMAVARLEKDAAKARREAAYFAARLAGLRKLLVDAGWADPAPNGGITLGARLKTDFAAASNGGYGGYDSPG